MENNLDFMGIVHFFTLNCEKVADKTWDPGFQKDPRAERLKILDCSD